MSNLVVGTAGHIDHGKSSLVRSLTGIDPDRLKEEKARGITIELGFAHTTIGETRVAFVDVPGHERFVRTMLAGVGGIDCVMLIVASDESVMPQTREHFDICRLLRIPRGIVVLTKADLTDPETRVLVRQDVAELVKGSFLESAPVVEVSATTGDGLDRLRQAIAAEAGHAARRPIDGAARLPIDRAFTMKGFGTVVTGTLVSGAINLDDELVIEPQAARAKVRGVQVHGRAVDRAVAGQRTAINLAGVELGDVSPGETLSAPGALSVTRRIDAEVTLLSGATPLKHGGRVRLHHGTTEVLGRMSIAGDASEIAAGQSALVRLRLERPAALTRGDRFIIRVYSPPFTVGGGTVLDPAPTRPGVRSDAGRAGLEALQGAETRSLVAMIDASALSGVQTSALVSRAGVAPKRLVEVMQDLTAAGCVLAGDRLVAGGSIEKAERDLLALVTATHTANAMSDGLAREEARGRIFARVAPAVFETVVERLKSRKLLVGSDRLAVPTHKATVAGADDRVRSAIVDAYRAGGLTPPDAAAIAQQASAAAPLVDKVTALLLREKVLMRLDTVVFHAEALETLKREVRALKESAAAGRATIDVAAFKARYGVSRKFAIPLLEYLDRERVTRRTGDVRLVL